VQAIGGRRGRGGPRGAGEGDRRHLLGDEGRPALLSGFGAGLRIGLLLGGSGLSLLRGGGRVARSWRARVAVSGTSMRPTLEPGDWLLVDPDAYRRRPPRPGELVVAPDPRWPDRVLVKRVAALEGDGRVLLAGDAAEASTDSRTFGAIEPGSVMGRAWFRIWPRERVGTLH
jgi:nickel-type superoxide dismutase maturation protease